PITSNAFAGECTGASYQIIRDSDLPPQVRSASLADHMSPLVLMLVLSSAPVAAISIALPGGPPVNMDYLAYDAANQRIWVPAGNTGSVDVIDVGGRKVTQIGGFPTAPSSRQGHS